MHNGGGTMTPDYAKGVPVKTLNSGPAAGVIAGAAVAASAGREHAVCLDMGGTSTDIGVVLDGRPRLTTSFDLEWGMPIRFPSIDVISIGSGGGSIAWLDPAGYPRSGPQSAGADPGPACYGKGGAEPTNTDAQLVLGRVSNDLFLDGRMRLDADRARAAIAERIAEPLGLGVEDAAEGVLRIANANMVKAIRLMTVERGFDPRELSLVAFGGAGPLHAVDLARELQMPPEVIVPPYPGVTSAMGLLFVDPLDDFSQAYVRRQHELDLDDVRQVYAAMEGRVVDGLLRQGVARADVTVELSVDLRYIGQLHSVTVPLGELTPAGLERAIMAFHDEHLRQYRYSHPDAAVETSTLRAAARGTRTKPDLGALRHAEREQRAVVPERTREVHFDGHGWVATRVVDRLGLGSGDELHGPCVVEELDTTLVLPPGTSGRVDAVGNVVIALTYGDGKEQR
jgi:N-methylhydantoinase A